MIGAFRQTLGIPDDIFPDVWRTTVVDDGENKTEENQTIHDDPCEIDPYSQGGFSGRSIPSRRHRQRGG